MRLTFQRWLYRMGFGCRHDRKAFQPGLHPNQMSEACRICPCCHRIVGAFPRPTESGTP